MAMANLMGFSESTDWIRSWLDRPAGLLTMPKDDLELRHEFFHALYVMACSCRSGQLKACFDHRLAELARMGKLSPRLMVQEGAGNASLAHFAMVSGCDQLAGALACIDANAFGPDPDSLRIPFPLQLGLRSGGLNGIQAVLSQMDQGVGKQWLEALVEEKGQGELLSRLWAWHDEREVMACSPLGKSNSSKRM